MSTPARCVLVDGDQKFLSVAHRIVAQRWPQLEIVGFFSSVEALEFVASHSADFIITDSQLPFVDGLRLSAIARSIDPGVFIVVMSRADVKAQALASGANAFIFKDDLPSGLAEIEEQIAGRVGAHEIPNSSLAGIAEEAFSSTR